jgi:hypothetical protein
LHRQHAAVAASRAIDEEIDALVQGRNPAIDTKSDLGWSGPSLIPVEWQSQRKAEKGYSVHLHLLTPLMMTLPRQNPRA